MNYGHLKFSNPHSVERTPTPDLTREDVEEFKTLIKKILGPLAQFTVQDYGEDEKELLVCLGYFWSFYNKADLIKLKQLLNK